MEAICHTNITQHMERDPAKVQTNLNGSCTGFAILAKIDAKCPCMPTTAVLKHPPRFPATELVERAHRPARYLEQTELTPNTGSPWVGVDPM